MKRKFRGDSVAVGAACGENREAYLFSTSARTAMRTVRKYGVLRRKITKIGPRVRMMKELFGKLKY